MIPQGAVNTPFQIRSLAAVTSLFGLICLPAILLCGCAVKAPSGGAVSLTADGTNTLGMKFRDVAGTNVAFSVWETRRSEYAEFVNATRKPWPSTAATDFAMSTIETPNHPAVNVSWADAKAFCEWLSQKEGMRYRLPTDHEWSVAVGLGILESAGRSPSELANGVKNLYPWGAGRPHGNYRDQAWARRFPGSMEAEKGHCVSWNDGADFTIAVGKYPENMHGLHDMGGNVWEWCEDRYGASSSEHTLRGGSWNSGSRYSLLSSFREHRDPSSRSSDAGFRVVLERAPSVRPTEAKL